MFREHEEITEMGLELLSSVLRKASDMITRDQLNKFIDLACASLNDTPEISFLPFSAFEFFVELARKDLLGPTLIASIPNLLRKFLFSESQPVRAQITLFLADFFRHLIHNKIPFDSQFYFHIVLFAFILQKERPTQTCALLADILRGTDQASRVALLDNLLNMSAHGTLTDAVRSIDEKFRVQMEKTTAVNPLQLTELICGILDKMNPADFDTASIRATVTQNTFAAVPFLLNKRFVDFVDAEPLLENELEKFVFAAIDVQLTQLVSQIRNFFAQHKSELLQIKLPELEACLARLLGLMTPQLKNNLTEFYNTFVQFSATFKTGLTENKIGVDKAHLRMKIENDHLPLLRELCTSFGRYTQIFRAVVATKFLLDARDAKAKPKFGLNKLINPLMAALDLEELPAFLADQFCEGLFSLVIVYAGEQKSPNPKIIEKLLKSAAISTNFCVNCSRYFQLYFDHFKESSLSAFSEISAFFQTESVLAKLGLLALSCPVSGADYKQTLELEVMRQIPSKPEAALRLASSLFNQLKKAHEQGVSHGLSLYLTQLLEEFKQRKPVVFRILMCLLEKNTLDFIVYAKIFVAETIKVLAEPGDKTDFYEIFVRVLTVAGLEGPPLTPGLAPALLEKIEAGTTFLLDFKNSKNFEFD